MRSADAQVRSFLRGEQREDDFVEILADDGCSYDLTDEIDLAGVELLIAEPNSPSNVVPVGEVAGTPVEQVVVSSSANPGLRDFAILTAIIEGRQTDGGVSRRQFDLAADPAGPHQDGLDAGPHRGRCTPALVRVHGLHRHGSGMLLTGGLVPWLRARAVEPESPAQPSRREVPHGRRQGGQRP